MYIRFLAIGRIPGQESINVLVGKMCRLNSFFKRIKIFPLTDPVTKGFSQGDSVIIASKLDMCFKRSLKKSVTLKYEY